MRENRHDVVRGLQPAAPGLKNGPANPRSHARKKARLRGTAGDLRAEGLRFGVVVARFNQFITQRLLEGALDALERLGARGRDVRVVWVPGAFEIPAAARRLAGASGRPRFHAIVCLGLILRGDTPHFDVISREVARGIGQSALESGVPHAFGVLTCDSLEEAVQRAGLKAGNKGAEAALAGVEMANLFARQWVAARPPVLIAARRRR